MTLALILAGHGSQISPHTAGTVWRYVDALRQEGVADEVTAAFWKEQPEFSQVLKTVTSDTVVIVPLFTSSGYFVRQVIPAEMGLDGAVTVKNGRTIYLTRTIGEHPAIADVVLKRVRDVIEQENLSSQNTSVAIIGHGTPRSNTTQETSRHQADILRDKEIVSQVMEAYLDDDPDIPSIYERTDRDNIIAVPFFLAEGSHVSIDLPDALGINYGDYPAEVQGRRVFYTPPVGTDDVILAFIIELMQEIGVEVQACASSEWDNFPRGGVDSLLEVLTSATKSARTRQAVGSTEDSLTIGQVEITGDVVRPIGSSNEFSFETVAEIRAHVRENPFRPLSTSDDLPCDWLVPVKDARQIPAIIETVYPGILAEWSVQYRGGFVAETWFDVMQRQQGMFRDLATLDDATLSHFVTGVCGRCIKHPSMVSS